MTLKENIILHGDVYACLNYLEDNSIAVAITSPPYWRQRDYKFDGQIGQEKTPEEYIGRLVKVFSKLRQKLREDGVFFLNVGDKYLNQYGKSHLLQIPYRLAYNLVKDGWYLEDIIIWYKPNHMPSSVKDRFTNTYEPVLVLSKDKSNIYQKKYPKVVEIPLQQTPWKHTAVYPESLVLEMLERLELKEEDLILDPFAGTGTTAVVVNKTRNNRGKKIYSVLIEKGDEFINIIRDRTKIEKVVRIEDVDYLWQPVKEEDFPEYVEPNPLLTDKHGEIYIAEDHRTFLSILKGITLEEFKKFHREDAIYFLGVKKWELDSLYYPHVICSYGYVLRNMLIISDGNSWYPVFMIARDSTRVAYRFYLDRVRIEPKTNDRREWREEEFIGMKVKDISGKELIEGHIVKILEKYDDCFPKLALVQWNGKASIEFVIHPKKDEFLMEGVKFFCPNCHSELREPYDPIGDNSCPSCGQKLWVNLETVPIVQEPQEISEIAKELENSEYFVGQILNINEFDRKREPSSSKFAFLERINWGASPGARKLMLGEYFTKMRLYRIDQPLVAQYLTLLRKSRNMSIQDLINMLPKEYYHTVGHWFRKDFGGSIPIPQDVELIERIFNVKDGLLKILKRTALKFQTVKSSVKGKNPGDFLKVNNEKELINFLRKLYSRNPSFRET